MKRQEHINDHIDSAELLNLVRSVEDKHGGSVILTFGQLNIFY